MGHFKWLQFQVWLPIILDSSNPITDQNIEALKSEDRELKLFLDSVDVIIHEYYPYLTHSHVVITYTV